MGRVWMLGQLAQQTQPHHARADTDRLAIMDQPTLDRYRAYLARIYRFEASVEAACIATDGLARSLVNTHIKSAKLLGDLEALGGDPRDVLPSRAIRFRDPAEALGWLWVVHRNTLLHGLIQRYLATTLPETMRVASAYLTTFEGRAGGLMRTLGDAIDDAVEQGVAPTGIASAAHEAFRMQRQWYSCDLLWPHRPPAARPRPRAPSQAA